MLAARMTRSPPGGGSYVIILRDLNTARRPTDPWDARNLVRLPEALTSLLTGWFTQPINAGLFLFFCLRAALFMEKQSSV